MKFLIEHYGRGYRGTTVNVIDTAGVRLIPGFGSVPMDYVKSSYGYQIKRNKKRTVRAGYLRVRIPKNIQSIVVSEDGFEAWITLLEHPWISLASKHIGSQNV